MGFSEDRMVDIITGRAPPPARAESCLSKGSRELARPGPSLGFWSNWDGGHRPSANTAPTLTTILRKTNFTAFLLASKPDHHTHRHGDMDRTHICIPNKSILKREVLPKRVLLRAACVHVVTRRGHRGLYLSRSFAISSRSGVRTHAHAGERGL